MDAPARGLTLDDVLPMANDYELVVMHTSTPSFRSDAKVAAALKEHNPKIKVGMVGAHVAVDPYQSMKNGAALDWVAGNEFDFTCKEIAEGHDYADIDGLTHRVPGTARSCATSRARCWKTWTSCPMWSTSISATS